MDEGGINVAPLTAHQLASTVALDAERATDWLRGARNKIKGFCRTMSKLWQPSKSSETIKHWCLWDLTLFVSLQ